MSKRDVFVRVTDCVLAAYLVLLMAGCTVSDTPVLEYNQPAGVLSDGVNDVRPDFDDGSALSDYTEADIVYLDYTIPAWNGSDAYFVLNGNEPFFDASDLSRTDPFETYSELDSLGRCGTAYANICLDLMPDSERGEIGSVKPSGWHTIRYNGLVPGNYLYNRCHLIGFQLAGENANKKNLITGTRYLNIEGMLGFENAIDDYVDETGNHVLYRVTPVYDGDDLVARGVVMEAYSVEDGGDGVTFNVFAYNNQPGVVIDYATGESRRADGQTVENGVIVGEDDARLFVLNTGSGKFHLPDCRYAGSMSEANRLEMAQTLDAMLSAGYVPCGTCKPDEAG